MCAQQMSNCRAGACAHAPFGDCAIRCNNARAIAGIRVRANGCTANAEIENRRRRHDRHARAITPIRPEDVLETTELTLVTLLRRHGGSMPRRELEAVCREAGMKPSSFNNRIAYSPIITERGYGRFGLRGNGAQARSGRAGDGAGEAGAGPALDDVPRPGDLEHFRRPQRR